MSIIDKFLNELNDRIQAVSAETNEIAALRNNALELGNILFSKNINKNNLTLNENAAAQAVVMLSLDDFSKISSLMGANHGLGTLEEFVDYKSVFNLYHNIKSKYGNIATADQYIEAINHLNHIGITIANYISEYTSEETDRLKNNVDTVSILKRYVGMFRAGVLVEPIFDFDKFHKVVDLCSLTPLERAEVKKIIGQTNFVLVMNQQFKVAFLEPVQKYRDFIQKKTKKARKQLEQIRKFVAVNKISNINTENASEIFSFIAEHNPEITYRTIQNCVISLLLKSELQSFDTYMQSDIDDESRKLYLVKTTQNAEEILALQNIKQVKKSKKTHEQDEIVEEALVPEKEQDMLESEAEIEAVETTSTTSNDIDSQTEANAQSIPSDNIATNDEEKVDQQLAKAFTTVNGKAITKQIEMVTRKVEATSNDENLEALDESLDSLNEETDSLTQSTEIIPEAQKLIDSIEKILKDEDKYLQSIYPGYEPQDHYERFTRLLTLVNANDNPDDKTRSAAIAETLRQELNAFRILAAKYTASLDDFKDEYEAKSSNIQGYLEVYAVLNERINQTKKKFVNQPLYLTNEQNQLTILDYSEELTDAQKKLVKGMHDDILKAKFKNINTQRVAEVTYNDTTYDVVSASRKNMIISYIALSEAILFLAFLPKAEDNNQNLKGIVATNDEQINNVILKSQTPEEFEMLYAEQASVRAALDDYFGAIVKGK